MGAPARSARAFRVSVRPGMSLGEVVVAATGRGRPSVFVRRDADAQEPTVSISSGSATVGQERAEGADAMRRLLDRRAAELRIQSIAFGYQGSGPVRSTVV